MRWEEKQIVVKVDRPGSYENSGIMLFYDKEKKHFGISSFGHCSCFGTWESTQTDPADWEGDIDELVTIVRNLEDINLRGRIMSEADYSFNEWKYFYTVVLEWVLSGLARPWTESIS